MYKKLTLKNGTRLIIVPEEHTKAATALVLYRVGSRYESKKINGVSHFIEHMMFKGTKRRPNTADISRELDAVGAEYNAFTGKDLTGYYVKIDSRHLPLALDMLHDMLYSSKFEDKELRNERKVIMEEIYMYKDNPMRHIDDMVENHVFAGSSLGWNIAGDKTSMDAIDRKAMLEYRDAHYEPSRTVVIIAGNVSDEAVKMAEKMWGSVSKRRAAKDFAEFKVSQKAPRVAVEHKDTEQIQLALGFPAYSHSDKRLPSLMVLANVLGGTMSSRLFINIRERKGLAYFVRSSAEPLEDVGMFLIRAGLTKSRIEEAISAICAELGKIKAKGITASELKDAKENIRGHLVLELEESSSLASFFGNQELYLNDLKTPDERLAELDAVTAAQVKAAANDVLRRTRASLCLIGPYMEADAKRFEKLLKI